MDLLFTGASGFLGINIKPILDLNYNITTVGMSPDDDYQVDLSKAIPSFSEIYDVVIHAAGMAHFVPESKEEYEIFFNVNYQGTVNLCRALERVGVPGALIFISSVAVYGIDSGENITEEHPLNGTSPYALSKIKAEEFLIDWCRCKNVILGIIRPSLLAGPNPPGNLGDMIKAIDKGKYLSIGRGRARKSVLMVQDIANLISKLAEKGGIYNVCDNYQPTFRELEYLIASQLGKKVPLSVPYWVARLMAWVGDCIGNKAPINSMKMNKITENLTFSSEKAQKELCWKPMEVISCFKIR
ncbi:NAD-dependent epimerase/dehydratase family protein [uncultured Bacteroides sp.]|uniref:NAD-dependent epimerase/dehydratase family protein n=1 Tax=uncultured Bacteroides sp. TaxID=162156 RepID=UPI002AAB8441|nr:NAD-dependent epimerase/dehydratase family protein [uncultured Bacteroides sp.]